MTMCGVQKARQNVFKFFDHDKSGTISFKEFCRGLSICLSNKHEYKYRLLFSIFDYDQDQLLSRDELVNFYVNLHQYISGSILDGPQ